MSYVDWWQVTKYFSDSQPPKTAYLNEEYLKTYQEGASRSGLPLETVVLANAMVDQAKHPEASVIGLVMFEAKLLPDWDARRAIANVGAIANSFLPQHLGETRAREVVGQLAADFLEIAPLIQENDRLRGFSDFFQALGEQLR